jgi:hypothetical protein
MRVAQSYFRKRKWTRKKMVAVYIIGNRMSAAFNIQRTHPKAKRYGARFAHIHAEQQATLNMPPGGNVYIYRETAHGHIAMARPCISCTKMLKAQNVKFAYYTTANGFVKERL